MEPVKLFGIIHWRFGIKRAKKIIDENFKAGEVLGLEITEEHAQEWNSYVEGKYEVPPDLKNLYYYNVYAYAKNKGIEILPLDSPRLKSLHSTPILLAKKYALVAALTPLIGAGALIGMSYPTKQDVYKVLRDRQAAGIISDAIQEGKNVKGVIIGSAHILPIAKYLKEKNIPAKAIGGSRLHYWFMDKPAEKRLALEKKLKGKEKYEKPGFQKIGLRF